MTPWPPSAAPAAPAALEPTSREGIDRNHRVRSFSRNAPSDPVAGVDYRHGTSAEAATVVPGSDVVVATLSPRGDTAGTVLDTDQALFDADGRSEISGPNFTVAVVDEIEAHAHPRTHISVAY